MGALIFNNYVIIWLVKMQKVAMLLSLAPLPVKLVYYRRVESYE